MGLDEEEGDYLHRLVQTDLSDISLHLNIWA
jgi:hypothetical protein